MTKSDAPTLDEATREALRQTVERLVNARRMRRDIARKIVWQCYQVKGLAIACALAGADHAPKARREPSAEAREALNTLKKRVKTTPMDGLSAQVAAHEALKYDEQHTNT